MRTLKLAHGLPAPAKPTDYRVIVVKNSTAYVPGETLCREEVNELCTSGRWDVTIVAFEHIGAGPRLREVQS